MKTIGLRIIKSTESKVDSKNKGSKSVESKVDSKNGKVQE